jgi:hypothetical protein
VEAVKTWLMIWLAFCVALLLFLQALLGIEEARPGALRSALRRLAQQQQQAPTPEEEEGAGEEVEPER